MAINKIRMNRITATGAVSALPEGGMVASSFLGLSDLGVRVSIENAPSNFMSAFSIPMGNISKDMLIDPKPEFKENRRSVIFPRGEKSYYYFKLTPNAPAGTFRLTLAEAEPYGAATLDETTAHIANDYLTFDCTPSAGNPEQCKGPLTWRDPFGAALWSIDALSGVSHSYPYLPSPPNGYTIEGPIIERDLNEAGGAYCDRYGMMPDYPWQGLRQCWSTQHFIPEPIFDTRIGRDRKHLMIHPRGGNATLGCIGLDPNFPTRTLSGTLTVFFMYYDAIKLIVQ